jgi:hypothetical protein
MAYERDNFYYAHRTEIFRRADELSRAGGSTGRSRSTKAASTRGRRQVRPRRRPLAKHYDTFLSHASEDKSAIARPLYDALVKAGVTVWYDEAVLTIGDSLRRKIDQGLSRCRLIRNRDTEPEVLQEKLVTVGTGRAGCSRKFVGRESHTSHLAQSHESQVAKYSPSLTDRLAGNSKEGVAAFVRKIKEALDAAPRRRRV